MAAQDNPYFIKPASALEALMTGVGGYDRAQKTYKEGQLQATRQEAGDMYSQGGDMRSVYGRLLGLGDAESVKAISGIGKVDQTDETKEYNLDMAQRKAQGLPTQNFGEWKTALKIAGSTKINNTVNTGEKEYDKVNAKHEAERFQGHQKGGQSATGAIGTLNLMEKLTADPNFYSGSASNAVTAAKRAGASLGITTPDAAGPNELFSSMANRLVLDAAGGSLGTGFSNADRDFIQSTVPALGNTPEGNRAIIGVQRKVYERQQEVAKMARDYAKANGGRMDAGFDQVLADYAEKKPLFPRAAQQPAQPAAPAARPQQGGKLQQFNSPADVARAGLKSGSRFLDSNGVERMVP